MPLWSSSSSTTKSSYSSSGGPPVLPPIVPLSPPSEHHLPTFLQLDRRTSSSASSSAAASPSSRPEHQTGTEEDDDPWQDDSDDEHTVKRLQLSKLSIAAAAPPGPSPSPLTTKPPLLSRSSTATTASPTSASSSTGGGGGGGGGGGWFSSFGSFGGSSSSAPKGKEPVSSVTPSRLLRRQPSAKDVAAAISSSPSHERSPSTSSNLGVGASTSPRQRGVQRGGSYIAGVNKVQQEAVRVVIEEERRKSLEDPAVGSARGSPSFAAANGKSSIDGEANRENESDEAREEREKRARSSEREKLKNSIRPDVLDLVRDPTHVLPRLRREWLSRPRPSPSITSSTSTPLSSTDVDTFRRQSISSVHSDASTSTASAVPLPGRRKKARRRGSGIDDDDDDGPPEGYAPLNASSLSSSAPKIVDYQKEYGSAHATARWSLNGGDVARSDGEGGDDGFDEEEEYDVEDEPGEVGRERRRKKKFVDVVQGKDDEVDLAELRKLSWGGIPEGLRPVVWMLLLGYLPSPSSRRSTTLSRKRQEYADAVRLAFSRGVKGLDGPIWHQISIDVPRTRPGVKLWMVEGTQRSLERILYVWAIRHPASGYVQGINDLVTPFFQVFLSLYIDSDPEEFDPSLLPPSALEALEADSFWCLSKLLDGIQDNYIFAQPGITRAVRKMEGLCKRVDAPLAKHLESEGVEFIQFAFRWMNCLLMRELSVKNIVRMWDTYLAEGGDAFSEFHLYVCLSFLVKWSEQLREMDFQSIIIFLQSLPTQNWTDQNTELLLSEAFMWSRTFEAR